MVGRTVSAVALGIVCACTAVTPTTGGPSAAAPARAAPTAAPSPAATPASAQPFLGASLVEAPLEGGDDFPDNGGDISKLTVRLPAGATVPTTVSWSSSLPGSYYDLATGQEIDDPGRTSSLGVAWAPTAPTLTTFDYAYCQGTTPVAHHVTLTTATGIQQTLSLEVPFRNWHLYARWCDTTSGEYRVTMRGTVFDDAGRPLAGAKVSAWVLSGFFANGSDVVAATTSRDGRYAIRNAPAWHTFVMTVEKDGVRLRQQAVSQLPLADDGVFYAIRRIDFGSDVPAKAVAAAPSGPGGT